MVAERARRPPPPGPYLVVGMARSGHAAAAALASRGERVIAVDCGRPEPEPLAAGVELRLEDDGLAALDSVACVVKSPGVPREAPVIAAAHGRGMPVIGELELAWRLTAAPVIAVTGTNGKTTTTEMIGHLLRSAGWDVAVVGNVGRPYSSLALPGAAQPRWVVCECSSFQLEDADAFAPQVAVLLNLAADHIDRHGSLAAYHAAKQRIFANQIAGDLALLPSGLELATGAATVRRFGRDPGADLQIGPHELRRDGAVLVELDRLAVHGPHNAENAAAAALVALELGLSPAQVADGLASFAAVAHRLQPVADAGGVLWVDDSKATNVAAALVALASFPGRPLHVICGGSGKSEDYAPLADALATAARHVYLIGEEADAIGAALAGRVEQTASGTLEQAVTDARAAVQPGDVVLLAPACASYDQFRDYEQRGEVFTSLARNPL